MSAGSSFTEIQLRDAAREGVTLALSDPTDTTATSQCARREKNAQGQTGEGTVSVAVECSQAATGVTLPCSYATSTGGIGVPWSTE